MDYDTGLPMKEAWRTKSLKPTRASVEGQAGVGPEQRAKGKAK